MTISVDFASQRTKMVDSQLRTTDVTNADILDAMLGVPREAFVPGQRQSLAYIDEDILVSPAGLPRRFLMQPSPFAKLLQLAEIRATDSVLDVGCATGYSAAVLSRLAASVVALEQDAELAAEASARLAELGCANVAVVRGPLEAGFPAKAPFDVVILEGSVGRVPAVLFDQLRDGGRLAAIEGVGNAGVARLYVKEGCAVSARRGFNAAVKPLPGFELVKAFEF